MSPSNPGRDTFAELPPASWNATTLCAGWSVHDVVAHLEAQHTIGQLGYLARLARAYGSVDRFNAAAVSARREQPPARLIAGLETDYRLPYFRVRPIAALYETVVHQQDIRRGLGRPHTLDSTRTRLVLGRVLADRVASVDQSLGVRLVATDLDWEHGQGKTVTGPAEALLMALANRPAALADLSGPGIATLNGRLR